MDKKLLVSVDEFSLVLFLPTEEVCENWVKAAYFMMNEFIELSKIELLLGKVVEMNKKKPQAYSQAFTIENVPYYFAIAFHDTFQHMGILVRFTGQAWAVYQQKYYEYFGKRINIAEFLKMIESLLYTYRLSRIDLAADYINYNDLSPHTIYNKLKDETYCVLDHNSKNTKRKISAVQNDMETETFYIGSRKENSQLLLRVYNKKAEQINTNGFRLNEALECENWLRLEASYKGYYAHQITEQLENINSDIELSQFIASKICDKYRFADVSTGRYTDFTNDLLALVGNSDYPALRTENPANNNLNKSIAHIISGSGLFPVCYKVGMIWGTKAEKELFQMLYDVYDKYYRKVFDKKPQIHSWLKKNALSLSKQKLSDCFLSSDISKADIDEILKNQPKAESIFNLTPIKADNSEYKEVSDEEFERLMNEL